MWYWRQKNWKAIIHNKSKNQEKSPDQPGFFRDSGERSVFDDLQFHPTVLGAPGGRVVGHDRLGLAKALGGQAISGNAALDQVDAHGFCTLLRQATVHFGIADVIRVTGHDDADLRVGQQVVRGLVEDVVGLRGQPGRSGCEVDARQVDDLEYNGLVAAG